MERRDAQKKPFRLCVSSDWHGDVQTLGVSRYDEVERAVHRTLDAVSSNNVDLYLFTGDLSDPDTGGAMFETIGLAIRVARRLEEWGIPSIWISGNHDVCLDGTGASTLTPLFEYARFSKLVSVALAPTIFWPQKGVAVVALPFTPPSHGVDLVQAAATLMQHASQADKVIVAAHLSVPGIAPGEETKEMPRGPEVIFPFEQTKNATLRICGHYHRQQSFDPGDGGPPIVVPGSLARLTFGEESHDPGFLIIDL